MFSFRFYLYFPHLQKSDASPQISTAFYYRFLQVLVFKFSIFSHGLSASQKGLWYFPKFEAYSETSPGGSNCMTCVTAGKSKPRAATSVQIKIPCAHLLKSRKVRVRSPCKRHWLKSPFRKALLLSDLISIYQLPIYEWALCFFWATAEDFFQFTLLWILAIMIIWKFDLKPLPKVRELLRNELICLETTFFRLSGFSQLWVRKVNFQLYSVHESVFSTTSLDWAWQNYKKVSKRSVSIKNTIAKSCKGVKVFL